MANGRQEVFEFSKSNQWKKILYLTPGNEPLIRGDRFYLSGILDKIDPFVELKKNIELFKSNAKNQEGQYYQCLFPARYLLLKSKWPSEFKDKTCKEYEEWKLGLDAGDLYLVFASSYVNNPASMFGHTFLRFSRKTRGSSQTTKDLIGYSLAFQANPDPDDNAFTYTYKGITGGYYANLEIKPHYINIGVYNNGESRDLWEYPLKLSTFQKQIMIAHAWEMAVNGAFEYYFFDQNCSTFMLHFLEASVPHLNFKTKTNLFVVPQTAVRETVNLFKPVNYIYRPSLEKRIDYQVQQLEGKDKVLFEKALVSKKELSKIKNVHVLDALVDYWKYKNYKKKTKLSKKESSQMFATLTRRARVEEMSKKFYFPENRFLREKPDQGQAFSKLSFGGGDQLLWGAYRYGFHSFADYELGYGNSAFIEFLNLEARRLKNNDFLKLKLKLLDILSLSDYSTFTSSLSWRGNLIFEQNDHLKSTGFAGVGLSKRGPSFQTYIIPGVRIINKLDTSLIMLGVDLGFKFHFSSKLKSVLEWSETYHDNEGIGEGALKLIYQKSVNTQLSIGYTHHENFNASTVDLTYFF